jgi:hypothetical protein
MARAISFIRDPLSGVTTSVAGSGLRRIGIQS